MKTSKFNACKAKTLFGLVAALALVLPVAAHAGRFIDLGENVTPNSISNNHRVVGARQDPDGSMHAIQYNIDTGTTLDIAGGARAWGVNELNQISGYTLSTSGAFLYSGNALQDLGAGYSAFAINELSQIAGTVTGVNPYRASPLPLNPAIYDAASSKWRSLDIAKVYPRGTRKGVYADQYVLFDINDAGYAVGKYFKAGLVGSSPILTTPAFNKVYTLSLPYGGYASAINNQNKVACTSGSYSGTYSHAYLYDYDAGTSTDLGTLNGGLSSGARDINNLNQVVGTSWLQTTPTSQYDPASYHAFIWENGVMTDLNSRIPADGGWILTSANTINDLGDIAGVGLLDGVAHGFVLLTQ
jgi:probable HAF family extracellular repeat protein